MHTVSIAAHRHTRAKHRTNAKHMAQHLGTTILHKRLQHGTTSILPAREAAGDCCWDPTRRNHVPEAPATQAARATTTSNVAAFIVTRGKHLSGTSLHTAHQIRKQSKRQAAPVDARALVGRPTFG